LWVKVDDRHVQSGTLRRNAEMNGDHGFSCPTFLAQERDSFHCGFGRCVQRDKVHYQLT
jgi:hypothetical protein